MGLMDSYRLNSIMGGRRRSPYQGVSFDQPGMPEVAPGATGVKFNAPRIQLGQTEPEPEEDDASKYYKMIQAIRSEQTPGMSAYKEALQGMPQEQEYKPNWMTRIASGLSGLSAGMRDAGKGVETAMSLNREPYRRAMEEYSNRLGGLKEQAGMEQEERESRMKAISDAANLGLKHQQFLETGRHHQALEGTAATGARANLLRAETAARPTYSLQATQGGFLAVNNKDPSDTKMIAARTPQDAQLEVSRMNAKTSRMQAGTSAAAQRETAEQHDISNALAGTRIGQAQQRINQAAPGNKPATPAVKKTAAEVAQEELFNDPEFSKYVYGDPADFDPAEWQEYMDVLRAKTVDVQKRQY